MHLLITSENRHMAKILQLTKPELAQGQLGGNPSTGGDLDWPKCRTCAGNMQFIAEVPLHLTDLTVFSYSTEWLLLFQCQNNPGLCEEWDAKSGGNAALLSSSTTPLLVPAEGEVSSPASTPFDAVEYDERLTAETGNDDNYWASLIAHPGHYFGKLGGTPVWLQQDETPACSCGAKMTFVIQIEEPAGGGMNFGGGGSAYGFVCAACKAQARFLWQC